MKSKKIKALTIGLSLVVTAVVAAKLFFVEVRVIDSGVITRFGKVVKVVDPKNGDLIEATIKENSKYSDISVVKRDGLVFKIPFIDSFTKYDNRLLMYDSNPREVMTLDKKKIVLDNNAQWFVENPLLFKVSMGTISNAQTRIEDLMYSKINEKVGKTEAKTLISDKARVAEITKEMADELNQQLSAYGIKIADVKIKRTNLPAENNESIYNRMRAERTQKATEYRSQGEEEALKIKSGAEKEAASILADARLEADKIKAEADMEAAKIYNDAYSQDANFYEFYRTLETYSKVIDKNTKLVIDSDSPFAKYIFGE